MRDTCDLCERKVYFRGLCVNCYRKYTPQEIQEEDSVAAVHFVKTLIDSGVQIEINERVI